MNDASIRALLTGAVVSGRSRAARAVIAVSLLLIVAAFVGLLVQDTPNVGRFSHDCFIYLNAGWRVLQGQAPNVDFHAPIGPVTPLMMAAAMKIVRPTGYSLPVAQALVCVVAVALTAIVGWRRVPGPVLAIYLLLPAAMALGIHQLGESYANSSYGSIFNRYAYALLLVFQLECLAPPPPAPKAPLACAQAAIAGFCVVAVFLTKANFVFPALLLVPVSLWLSSARRTRALWLAFGATVALLFFGAFLRFDYAPLAVDYFAAARHRMSIVGEEEHGFFFIGMSTRTPGMLGPAKMLEVVRNEIWAILVAVVAALVFPLDALESIAGRTLSRGRFLLGVTALVVAPLVVVFTNWQWGELVTTPATLVAMLAWVARWPPAADVGGQARLLALAGLAVLPSLQIAARSFYSIVYSLGTRTYYDFAPRIDAPPVHDIHMLWADSNCEPAKYVPRINEGLALLRQRSAKITKGIWVMDFTDPFSFALRLPMPKDDVLWWDARGTTFSAVSHPDPDVFLANVDVVMVPKCPEDVLAVRTAESVYGPWLAARYAESEQTANWIVLEKRASDASGGAALAAPANP